MENLIQNVSILIVAIGILAFVTSVITQVTKTWGFLNKIPTAIQVSATSLILTVLAVVIYIQLNSMTMVWYYIVGAVLLSFFVSFVTTNGWDQLMSLWNRFYKNPTKESESDKNE